MLIFLITLIRGFLVITPGAVLFFQPDKTRSKFANFMGIFWVASGIINLRWSASAMRAKYLGILAVALGVFAGIAMLTPWLTNAWIRKDILFSQLRILILLTGVLHTLGGFRASEEIRKWSLTSLPLGVIEIVLGIMLIIEPLGRSYFSYLAASIWALVGGLILNSDVVRIRQSSMELVK